MKMTGSLYVNATLRQPRRIGGIGDRLRRCGVGERVDLLRLGDVPVLTEAARQVAAGGAERQHRRAGQEVVERLLLDRIDAEPRRAAVGREDDFAALHRPHEAQATLALAHLAGTRADVALHPTVAKRMPVGGRDGARREVDPYRDARSYALSR